MNYIKELMADYKDEINDILSYDPLLAKEIQYDLQQENKIPRATPRARKIRKSISIVSPTNTSPSPLNLKNVPKLRRGSVKPYAPSPARININTTIEVSKENDGFKVPITPARRCLSVALTPLAFKKISLNKPNESPSNSLKRSFEKNETPGSPKIKRRKLNKRNSNKENIV